MSTETQARNQVHPAFLTDLPVSIPKVVHVQWWEVIDAAGLGLRRLRGLAAEAKRALIGTYAGCRREEVIVTWLGMWCRLVPLH